MQAKQLKALNRGVGRIYLWGGTSPDHKSNTILQISLGCVPPRMALGGTSPPLNTPLALNITLKLYHMVTTIIHGYYYDYQCCGSGLFFRIRIRFLKIRIRIRIRVTPKRLDPTRSGSYLDMFLMFSKKKILWHFYTKSKHVMTLKIKEKFFFLTKLYFRQFYITRKLEL